MNTRLNRRTNAIWLLVCISLIPLLLAFMVFGSVVVAESEASPQAATIIIVDSGTDPDNSKSKTCVSDTPCTLRRAIVQARTADRPVSIQFNIPARVDEGYVPTLRIWKLNIMTTSDPAVFRALEGGNITIDGSTQPGGRNDGPRIVIVGPGTGQKDGLIVGVNNSGSHDSNVVRGLAFQNFRTHMYVNSNQNIIENNWFGLSDDGSTSYLRRDDPEDGSGNAGIALGANVTANEVRNNVFLGFDGVAVALRGSSNVFSENWVGTNSDGEVPGKQTTPSLICTRVDWLGGGGISLDGDDTVVEDNVFAGLRQEIFQISQQPDAIRVSGDGHSIRDNIIGVDTADREVGVCGRGIYLSDGPSEVLVLRNQLVQIGLSAISLNGALIDANTLSQNTIKRNTAWPEVPGQSQPEDAIQLGKSLPAPFLNFKPARVTGINGLQVSGTSGTASPCPNCIIELFLDDADSVTEALGFLVSTTANGSGNWTATLPFLLQGSQGIRTTSTTAQFNTIPNMSAGTTTGLSVLYLPPQKNYTPLMLTP